MPYPVAFSDLEYSRAALRRILSFWQSSQGQERAQSRDAARIIMDEIKGEAV